MLIKLIEIYEEINHVEKAENFKKRHLLREIVVNTDFIVIMRADNTIEKYIKENPSSYEGLINNQQFTRLTVNKGSISNDIIILGSLEQLSKMIDMGTKKVLKG